MGLYSKLNQELVEEFGRLEQLCNQLYGVNHGVTSYIEDMDNISASAKYRVDNWDYYYKNLKLVRHKRNQLSHGEVLFSEKFAESEDIQFVSDFHRLIINSNDPLSLYRKKTEIFVSAKDDRYTKRENGQNRGCLSEFIAFFISLLVCSVIIMLLILFFSAYLN